MSPKMKNIKSERNITNPPSALRSAISGLQPSTTPSLHYSTLGKSPAWPGLCPFLAMAGASRPLVPAALSAESWEVVFQQTLLFADYQVRRLRWRGQIGGRLLGGFDPDSIAAQAIMEYLQQCTESVSEHCRRRRE